MLTQQRLHELFEYREDGTFVRKSNNKAVPTNMTAGHRYLRISVDGKPYSVHRCVYMYHHGVLPKVVDHIDNDCKNNRIENLRAVTQQQNCLNRVRHKHSKSPHKNVYWNAAAKKWAVVVSINGRREYFGVHDDIEFADLVAQEVRNKYHGKFANHGGAF